jgi:hypothetical protein
MSVEPALEQTASQYRARKITKIAAVAPSPTNGNATNVP